MHILLIDGLGHATWSMTVLVSPDRTRLFHSSAYCARAVGFTDEQVVGVLFLRDVQITFEH